MNKRLVIVDTETGGLDPNEQSILSLGACIWEDSKIGNTLHLVIREPVVIATPEALKVNGLTTEEIENGATPATAVELLTRFLRDNDFGYSGIMLGGHNVGFDIGFMKRLFRLANKKWPFSHRVMDTQIVALALGLAGKLNTTSTTLDSLTSHFNINVRAGGSSGKHNALEDATATGELLTRLLMEMGATISN